MNSIVEILNHRGGSFLSFAWPMLWQSSLLIAVLAAFDFAFRRKLRASVRYALWLVVLMKLCIPPTLALPTSPAWWLHKTPPPVVAKPLPHYTVTYDNGPLPQIPQVSLPVVIQPKPSLNFAAWLLVGSAAVSLALFVWLLVRWWQVARLVRGASAAERFSGQFNDALRLAGAPVSDPACSRSLLKHAGSETGVPGTRQRFVQLKIVNGRVSPAVCGLFRPAILIPQSLAENFSDEQLRAVLLHELIHLRRRDVWVNFLQALLQIVYWWHPLLWLANARIRRVREEAVDDAVMLALRDEAEAYAPTLLEVAKFALNRPLASLGLVGIIESRSALRQRIERLVDFKPPHQAGLTLVSLLGILAFTAVAVPMGEGPAPAEKSSAVATTAVEEHSLTVTVNPEIFIRNVKAQAGFTLHATNDDYTGILLDVLRGEEVDTAPPHGLAFNTHTGEITTQNKPEQLEIFRQVIEQLNQADGKCELPLRNNFRRKSVLIEARIYQMPAGDFQNIVSGLQFYRGGRGSDAWWSVSPEKFKQFVGSLELSGLQLIQRPRIQTGSGMTASFYVGDAANSVEFDCKPFAKEGFVDLTLQSTVISGRPANTFTNRFGIRASAEDHGGIVVRVENFDGDAGTNLVAVIGIQIVTNLVAGGSPPVNTAAKTLRTMTFKLDHPVSQGELKETLLAAGVEIPTTAYFYTDSGMMLVRGSEEQLARVNRLVLKLNGFSPKEVEASNNQFIKEIGDVGFGNISTTPMTNLFSRHFRVDTNLFTAALQKATGMQAEDVPTMARSLFNKLGVDLDLPGKSVFYGDRLGELFVRATKPDLDVIEQALSVLISAPPQIHIKARFLEVPKGTLAGLENVITVTNQPVRSNQVAGSVGILTDKNFRTVLHNLEARSDAETLAEPEVVTTSGRQAQMRATQTVVTIVTNFVFQENAANGTGSVVTQTSQIETGPVLDVVPYALSDGYTINLTVIPSLIEFLGYDAPPTNTTATFNRAGEKIDLPKSLPRFTVRQVTATLNLWDDQTAIISGLPEKDYVNGKEVAGKSKASDKELLIFVTATIIDPAGNRVHADKDLPFAQNGIPPQPPQPK